MIAKIPKYVTIAKLRISDARSKLDSIKRRMDIAVEHQRIDSSEQLQKSVARAEHHFEIVELKLELMRQLSDDRRDDAKRAFDQSWDDLAHSIKNLVARL